MSEASPRIPIESADPSTSVVWPWFAVSAVVVFAAVMYKPWQPIPLPISDWGGMLPILTGETTVSGRFHGLMDLFTRAGRYQPVIMAAIALTWSAFAADTVAWQWIRFGVMTGILVGCVALARRLGASLGAAVAAALLLVVSGMARQSWVVLQLAEPVGTLFLVGAALLAIGYGTSERWIARALGIVTLLVLAILSKETFIVGVPFVLALGLWARSGARWAFRRPTKRELVLVATAIVAIGVVNVVPVLNVRRLAEASAYAARYDFRSASIGKARNVLSAMFLPVTRVWLFPANAAFLAALLAGVILGVRRHGRSALLSVGVLLSLLLAGAVTYLPWFALEGYYAFAFLPALIALFALSLTWLWESRAKAARPLAIVACGLVTVFGALFTSNYLNAHWASRMLEARTARALDGLRGDTLVAGVPSPAESGSFATGLRGYALALGVSGVPPGRDVACPDAFERVSQRATSVVVVFSTLCGSQPVAAVTPSRVIRESYSETEWRTFARSRHEVNTRIWAGGSPRGTF